MPPAPSLRCPNCGGKILLELKTRPIKKLETTAGADLLRALRHLRTRERHALNTVVGFYVSKQPGRANAIAREMGRPKTAYIIRSLRTLKALGLIEDFGNVHAGDWRPTALVLSALEKGKQ